MIFNIHTFAWILYNYTYKLWTYQYYHHLTPVVMFYEWKLLSNFILFYSIVTFILSYYTIYYLIIIQYHCHVGFFISSIVYKNTAISLRDNRWWILVAYESINISNRSPISSILVREPIENFQRPFELNFFRTDDIQKARSIQAIVNRQ